MTSLWILSDLHQECPENRFDPQAFAPAFADVVVAAGDIHMPLARSIDWLADRLPGARIVCVPGNHEFWRRDGDRYCLQDVIESGRERAAARGIDLLVDGDIVLIGDTRFVGGTLWTDFTNRPAYESLTGAVAEANRRMNDYRRIRYGGNRSKNRLELEDTIYLHRRTRARIEAVLAEPHDGPTVVVTHHAPHPACLPAGLDDLAWCYASDLTPVIEAGAPALWLHGHVHGRIDTVVGETRIVANARGHVEEMSCGLFDPSLVVEVYSYALTPGP